MRVLDSITDAINDSNDVGIHEILLVKPEENLVLISCDGFILQLNVTKDLADYIQRVQKKNPSSRLAGRVVFNRRRARLYRITRYFKMSSIGGLEPIQGETRLKKVFSLYMSSVWIGAIYLLVAFLWYLSELIIYGETMPRVLHDLIALIMAILIYMLYRTVSKKR